MARPSVDDLMQITHLTTMFNWDFEITRPPAGLLVNSGQLNMRCETTGLPTKSGESIPLVIRGNQIKQPGIYRPSGPFTVQFAESEDHPVLRFMMGWLDICWSPGRGIQRPNPQVKADITVYHMGSNDRRTWFYSMMGCFLEDFSLPDLDGNASDLFRPAAVISYDDFKKGPM